MFNYIAIYIGEVEPCYVIVIEEILKGAALSRAGRKTEKMQLFQLISGITILFNPYLLLLADLYSFWRGLVMAQESHSSWREEKPFFFDSINDSRLFESLKVTE